MAYYIFLKSLRSLEEFRKNPHVKIPPKSPSTIFQSLAIIKNQILFGKEFFLHIRPNWPSSQPAHLASQPSQPHRPPPLFTRRLCARARPIPACAALAYLPKVVSSSSLRSPVTTPSPSVTATRASPVGFVVSPAPANPGRNFSVPPLPHAATPRLGCPRAFTALPHYSPPPLIPFKPSVNGP
jgi:hypothetical protein